LLNTAVKWVSSLVSVKRVLMIVFLPAGWCAVKHNVPIRESRPERHREGDVVGPAGACVQGR
jgi:hypothetical protein